MNKRIKEAREREKLSQSDLAAAAGVSTSQICRFESGKRRPHLDEARKIAALLKLPISEIDTEDLTTSDPITRVKGLLAEAQNFIDCAGEKIDAAIDMLEGL
jgi:transcriptional regulator with XRE-family HTH domain